MRSIGSNSDREECEATLCVVSHQLVQCPRPDCRRVGMEQPRDQEHRFGLRTDLVENCSSERDLSKLAFIMHQI